MLRQLRAWCLSCLGVRRAPPKPASTPDGNPLPAVVHKVLQPSELGPGRIILVGDIHGCYRELMELLQKVGYAPRHDNLILVGDLVNKGPHSQQVVAAARAWCEGSFCWVVRGNHDDAALAAYNFIAAGGAVSDLDPKLAWVTELTQECAEFLAELPFSLELRGCGVLVVHAGLIPGLPLQQQDLGVLTKVRDLVRAPDGRSFIGLEKPQDNSQPWAGLWAGPCHVLFGHDAKRGLQDAPYATGLDTGCVYGRQLTACVLPPAAQLLQAAAGGWGDAAAPAADAAAAGVRDRLLGDQGAAGSSSSSRMSGGTTGSKKSKKQAAREQQQQQVVPALPPALVQQQQQQQQQQQPQQQAHMPPPTLKQLRGTLHSVPSAYLFDKAAAKAAKAEVKARKGGKLKGAGKLKAH